MRWYCCAIKPSGAELRWLRKVLKEGGKATLLRARRALRSRKNKVKINYNRIIFNKLKIKKENKSEKIKIKKDENEEIIEWNWFLSIFILRWKLAKSAILIRIFLIKNGHFCVCKGNPCEHKNVHFVHIMCTYRAHRSTQIINFNK